MSIDLGAPPTSPPAVPAEAPPAPGRRRLVRLLALVMGILFLFLGITALIWVEQYDPLGAGSSGFRPDLSVDPRSRDVSAGQGPVQTLWTVRPTEGAPFTYAFSIHNDGPVSITVTSIGLPMQEQRGDMVTRVAKWVDPDPYDRHNVHEPFHAFTLEPGAEANVWMEATVTHCEGDGGTMSWSSEPIVFRVFGLTRSTYFTPDSAIGFVGGRGGCARV
jgi:hypothetical protein